ncbi:MAG: LLM class flavin-dependent oxidoreductase [Acidimicrobiia bacterium]|nr:LLM class flavin-dependent oxidoreductase [Acidimicrobiia bacterium]
MPHDLVISPFGALAKDMVEAARCAEESGFDGVWTYDHLTGTMLDRGHSHDVFAVLGAMASATERVTIGPMVANMMNRHPAQLTVAMRSLQSLSSGRAVLGLGSGASPDSVFGAEHRAVGIKLLRRDGRARMLIETIELVRLLWAGGRTFSGEFFDVDDLDLGFEPPLDPLSIIIGASSPATVGLALDHADGVNINTGPNMAELLSLIGPGRIAGGFETSVHLHFDPDHPYGAEMPPGTDKPTVRRMLAIRAPYDLAAVTRVGARLHARA